MLFPRMYWQRSWTLYCKELQRSQGDKTEKETGGSGSGAAKSRLFLMEGRRVTIQQREAFTAEQLRDFPALHMERNFAILLNMNVKIIIAMHKPYPRPKDPMYLPLQVGAAGKEGFGIKRDDEGDNISAKNPGYCELTGLYHAWKNLSCDAVGLVHYRRYFAGAEHILTGEEAEGLLLRHDVLVPVKRRYWIESLFSHYAHTLEAEHLIKAREIVAEWHPAMIPALDTVYSRTWGYMFNMYVMGKELSDEYCQWLFPILFELEKRLLAEEKTEGLSAFEARLYGRVSEILFNVWLLSKEGLRIKELPLYETEKTNWLKKGSAFLMAKFFGKKYKESF